MSRWLGLALALCTSCAAEVGKYCATHDDCNGLKDGYCARVEICTRECVIDSGAKQDQCPAGSNCVQDVRRAVCLPQCTSDHDCQKGFGCVGGDAGVCLYLDALNEPPPSQKK